MYNKCVDRNRGNPVLDIVWGEDFEWDEEKNLSNLKKHGVDFRDAAAIFDDADRIEFFDAAHSGTEDRYNTIGMVRDILFVVYTERRERIRMISARKAAPFEKKMYYDRKKEGFS